MKVKEHKAVEISLITVLASPKKFLFQEVIHVRSRFTRQIHVIDKREKWKQ